MAQVIDADNVHSELVAGVAPFAIFVVKPIIFRFFELPFVLMVHIRLTSHTTNSHFAFVPHDSASRASY